MPFHRASTRSPAFSFHSEPASEDHDEAQRARMYVQNTIMISQRHDLDSAPYQIELNGQPIALVDGYPSEQRIKWEVEHHDAQQDGLTSLHQTPK